MGDLFTAVTDFLNGLLASRGIPDAAIPWIFAVARAFLLGFSGLLLVVFLIWYERKLVARMQDRIGPNRVGPFGLFQTFADMLKLVLKEDLVPPRADRILFSLAPILAVMGVVGLWAVIPIAATAYGADLEVGALFLIAAGSLGTLGILMAGWSSGNKFALLGAFRVAAQLVSYAVPAMLAVLIPVMLSGTMRLTGIVEAQGGMWFAAAAPLAALVFLIASLAEVARAPFELLEAESEIVAGYHVEYSGIRFGMFFAAEFLHAFTIGALLTVLFLGGWRGPGAEQYPTLGAVYFAAKSFAAYSLLVWARATLPRVRIDQMLDFCWKVLVPAMIVLVAATAVVDRALADSPPDIRQWALLGLNVLVTAAAVALLGRRPRLHPLTPSPSPDIRRDHSSSNPPIPPSFSRHKPGEGRGAGGKDEGGGIR
jgi:NADH-quinone oxidoreductase subunit H